MLASLLAENLLQTAIDAVADAGDLHSVLEALPAPIYVTDSDGVVTHFNKACIGFAGRMPAIGKDRWCVTWKLYTDDGVFLPHDACPMAEAIHGRKIVRGVTAVAERPDGVRVTFMPLPTPLFGVDGQLVGAINMLIDVTEHRQIAELRENARRCHRLAVGNTDQRLSDTLKQMAAEYEIKAEDLEETVRERPRLVA